MKIEQIKEMLAKKITSLNDMISHAQSVGDIERYNNLNVELEETELTLRQLQKDE